MLAAGRSPASHRAAKPERCAQNGLFVQSFLTRLTLNLRQPSLFTWRHLCHNLGTHRHSGRKRSGFAARCEAGLCPAVAILRRFGLCPWFGLCPKWLKGEARTRGIAQRYLRCWRRGGAPPHIGRQSRSVSRKMDCSCKASPLTEP